MTLVADASHVAEWMGWPDEKAQAREGDIERCLAAASSTIRRMAGRDFEKETGARIFEVPVTYDRVPIDDLRAASKVEYRRDGYRAGWETIEPGGYELRRFQREWPYQLIVRSPGRFPQGSLRITGDWGWEEVPPAIQQATIMEAAKLLARSQSPKQVGSSFTGTETNLADFMDFDILSLVDDFKLPQVA